MEVKIIKNIDIDQLRTGDALVMDYGQIRIIVEVEYGYGLYAPELNEVHFTDSKYIKDLIDNCEDNIVRVIKSKNLVLTEI